VILFKKIWGLRNLRLCGSTHAWTVVLFLACSGTASAESCIAPSRPFVPSDPEAAKLYADIIRQDFENYIRDVQEYFRCLDAERARAFEEAREVVQEYGRFSQTVDQ